MTAASRAPDDPASGLAPADPRPSEESIAAGELQYRDVLELMPSGFAFHRLLVDPQGKPADYVFLEINPAFERLTGLTRDRILGRRVTEVIPGIDKDPADWIGRYGRVALSRTPDRFEQHAAALDRWYAVTAFSPAPGTFATVFTDITDRKREEQERQRLLESVEHERRRNAEYADREQRRANELAAVFEQTRAQLALLDRELRFVMVNDAYARGCGHSKESLPGRSHFELFPHPENEVIFRRVRDTGAPYTATEKPFEYLDQPERGITWWNWSLAPIRGPDGAVEGLLLSLFDVTAQVRDREAAVAASREIEATFAAIADGLVVFDAGGRMVRANPAAVSVFGFDPCGVEREQIGRRVDLRSWPDRTPLSREQFVSSRALRGEAITGERQVLRRQDGERVVEVSATPLRSARQVVGAVAVFRDVTESVRLSRRAEAMTALTTALNAERGLQPVLEASAKGLVHALGVDGAAVLLLESDGERLRAAAAAGSGEDRRGGLIVLGNWPHGREALEEGRAVLLTPDRLAPSEQAILRARGAAAAILAPLIASGRRLGVLALELHAMREVSADELAFIDLMAANCALAIDRAAAYDTAREEATLRERFMAILGHDLRNPLAVISTSVAQLARRGGLDERALTAIARVERSADSMNAMIRDLLDFTRSHKGGIPVVPRPCDALEIARRAVEQVQAAHPEVQIDVRAEGDARGTWDPDRLLQVLSNLLANAVEYGSREQPLVVEVRAASERVEVSVENRGPPIPGELLAAIFEPFRQARAPGSGSKGLGLGLFIVREIVRAHGGEVDVSSTAEATRFTVRLPRARP